MEAALAVPVLTRGLSDEHLMIGMSHDSSRLNPGQHLLHNPIKETSLTRMLANAECHSHIQHGAFLNFPPEEEMHVN